MEKVPDFLKWIIVALVVFVVAYLIGRKKITKAEIAKYYNISRPTLQKWIAYFQNDVEPEAWKKMRFLNFIQAQKLKSVFGNDMSLILSKADICRIAESDYKVVADNVKRNVSKLGISIEAWESCNVFPPVISARILDMLVV